MSETDYRIASATQLVITLVSVTYKPRQPKKCIRKCAIGAHSDHPAHAQNIILAFALHSYILTYPTFLLADSEGPDQTAWMR